MAENEEDGHEEPTSKGILDRPNAEDFICVICLQLLIEPVVLPCRHELCMPCFREHVNSTSLCCPMCRMRISSWARKKSREGSLVDQKRWKYIQKLFPERCKKRLSGEDDDDDDYTSSSFIPIVAKEGELRKEYETELEKVEEEIAKENQASEEVIKAMLQEEEAYQKDIERDEKFAEELQKEELNKVGGKCFSPHSKLEQALNVLKLPKEMTLRSSSLNNIKSSPVDEKSKSCMSKWLSKSQRDPLESLPFGGNSRASHRSKQEEDDFHMAFKLQKQLDMQSKRNIRIKTLNEQFFSPKKAERCDREPPAKRVKSLERCQK